MFSSSVRRAVAQPSPFASAVANVSAPRMVCTQTVALKQRRYSSSKPSSPADGRGVVVPVVGVKADAKKSKGGKKAKKSGLPSVPSTGHLQVKEIAASSFFSLHRPISVTSPFPKSVSDESFASIFTPKSQRQRVHDVLSTLSNSVKTLDQERWNAETDQLRAAIAEHSGQNNEVHHLDGLPDNAIPFPTHIMQGRYQPFNAPPAPVPMDTADSLKAGLEAANEEVQHRTYVATLTVEESTDVNGEVTYSAHTTPLVDMEEPEVPRSFGERMYERRQRFEERSERDEMLAISVKRQRKLKMKKHKYKKLMRRTRNLRRRLDRN